MDFSSVTAGAGGAATAIEPFVHRLSLFLQKRSKKKDMHERLRGALSAIGELEQAHQELADIGKEFLNFIESAQLPISPGFADKIYANSGKWMKVHAKSVMGLVKLAQQAQSLSKMETVMSDMKHLDRPTFELVQLLNRSYKEGKLELTDFPTFIGYYGPKNMEEVAGRAQAITDAITPKLESIAETLPEPWRTRRPVLRRSYEEMTDAHKNIATTNESVIQNLLAKSPPWMRTLAEISDKAVKRGAELALKRANRYTPRSPPPPNVKWPTPGRRK